MKFLLISQKQNRIISITPAFVQFQFIRFLRYGWIQIFFLLEAFFALTSATYWAFLLIGSSDNAIRNYQLLIEFCFHAVISHHDLKIINISFTSIFAFN